MHHDEPLELRLIRMLLWLDHREPELVATAETMFKVSLMDLARAYDDKELRASSMLPTPLSAAVEVCLDCDIAECQHIRERRAAAAAAAAQQSTIHVPMGFLLGGSMVLTRRAREQMTREQVIADAARALAPYVPHPIFDVLQPDLIGEFTHKIEVDNPDDPDGNPIMREITIPWYLIKDIIQATLMHLGSQDQTAARQTYQHQSDPTQKDS